MPDHIESRLNAVLNARLQTVAPEMKRIRMIVSFDDEPGRQAAADLVRCDDAGPGYNHTTPLRTLHESSARFGSGRDARPPRDERGSPPAQGLPFRPSPPPQLPLGPLSLKVPAERRHAPPAGSMAGSGLEPGASLLLHSPSASPLPSASLRCCTPIRPACRHRCAQCAPPAAPRPAISSTPSPEIAVPTSIRHDSGSPNIAHAQMNVTGGLRNSTLVTRAGDERRRQAQ